MSATSDLPKKSHRVFLAGDALITKPWSGVDDRAFLDLVGEMRQANTTIINLETLIHEYKGYAQAHSGGAYMTLPPEIATELKWAGVNMVSHANNHAFDYGSEGIIETHENISGAGIVIAGKGVDLQSARAPKYYDSNNANVALVSMASTFISYGAAISWATGPAWASWIKSAHVTLSSNGQHYSQASAPIEQYCDVCWTGFRQVYCPRVLGQWFDGIRFYAAASSPRRSRRTWAGLR